MCNPNTHARNSMSVTRRDSCSVSPHSFYSLVEIKGRNSKHVLGKGA